MFEGKLCKHKCEPVGDHNTCTPVVDLYQFPLVCCLYITIYSFSNLVVGIKQKITNHCNLCCVPSTSLNKYPPLSEFYPPFFNILKISMHIKINNNGQHTWIEKLNFSFLKSINIKFESIRGIKNCYWILGRVKKCYKNRFSKCISTQHCQIDTKCGRRHIAEQLEIRVRF